MKQKALAKKDYDEVTDLKKEQQLLFTERKQLSDELQKAQRELKEEAEGTALSGAVGHGPIYKDKELYMEQCKQRLDDWDGVNKKVGCKSWSRVLEMLIRILKYWRVILIKGKKKMVFV